MMMLNDKKENSGMHLMAEWMRMEDRSMNGLDSRYER